MRSILVSMIAVAGLASAASAQFFDGFEAYPDGPLFAGGWDGWDGSPGARGVVTSAFAYSGEKSILIAGGADAVHPFAPGEFSSGQWTMTAWMLLFRNDHTSDTFFIVNNVYNHNGPYQWTIEMQFDVATGNVLDDFRPENVVPIAYDRWVEIRLDIDLDADTVDTYYDGALLSSGQYAIRGGPVEIGNIDLFTTGATSYYDDLNIVPAPGAMGLLALGAGAFMRRRRRR